jgi:hypothetical protein
MANFCSCHWHNCEHEEIETAIKTPEDHAMSGTERRRPQDCTHENFTAKIAVGRILDVGKFVADITVNCVECGEPFRFVGVPAGLSYEHPAVSIDGLELHAPIEPEIEKRLHDRATFQVTPVPTRQ